MRLMGIDRRRAMLALAATATAGLLPRWSHAEATDQPVLLTSAAHIQGGHVAAGLTNTGRVAWTLPLPKRGHGGAVNAKGDLAVIFARRPRRFAVAVDPRTGRKIAQFETPEGRHFQGHGIFDAQDRMLIATENAYEEERGVLGLYDAADGFRRIGEWDAGGLDPHDLVPIQGGKRIAVTLGGILTHPDYPRAKLNLDDMRPGLAILEADGRIVSIHAPEPQYAQLSIRHLAEAPDGTIWFGCQYEGDGRDSMPLVGVVQPGIDGITWVRPKPQAEQALRQYVGSVAACRETGLVAVSSPRGGHCLIFDAASRALVADWPVGDVCGLAARGPDLLASDGQGRLWRDGAEIANAAQLRFDNHMVALPG